MSYGKGKTEGGHKRGHSAMALWVTHQEAKAQARKQRRLLARSLERHALLEAEPADQQENACLVRLNAAERQRLRQARRRANRSLP